MTGEIILDTKCRLQSPEYISKEKWEWQLLAMSNPSDIMGLKVNWILRGLTVREADNLQRGDSCLGYACLHKLIDIDTHVNSTTTDLGPQLAAIVFSGPLHWQDALWVDTSK